MAQAEMHLSLLEKELLTQSKLREQGVLGNSSSGAPLPVSPAKNNRAWRSRPQHACTEAQTQTLGHYSGTPEQRNCRGPSMQKLYLQTAPEHLAPDRAARAPRDGSASPDRRGRKSLNMGERAWRSRSPSKSPKKTPSSPQTPLSLQLEDLMVYVESTYTCGMLGRVECSAVITDSL